MTTEVQRNELLEDFHNYLEQSKLEQVSPNEQPDLNTLLSELTGLKTEVKAESRQFKNTLDMLSSALTTVQDDNKTLAAELVEYTKRLEQQKREMMQTMLLEMVDIYDRLTTGLEVIQNYQPLASMFKQSRKEDVRFIRRFKEGQDMTIRRFEQLLRRYQVQMIDCVGKQLDPVTMSAIETAHNPKLENGIVLEELRKGFLFQDQVLRLAEVKVNKTNSR
jgi:molecular chaperone GrpE